MRVQPINDNKREYLRAGAFGVVSGYALKYALPLSEYERNSTFTEKALETVKHAANGARRAEYYAIVDGAREGTESIAPDVLDAFVSNKANLLYDTQDVIKASSKDLNKKAQEGLLALAKRVHNKGKEAEELSKKSFEAMTKSSRASLYFVALTSAVFLSLAVLKNSLKANMVPQENDSESISSLNIKV